MLATQVTELTLGGRFSGPPATANGGYACGTIAELLGGDVEVTLRRPPPLGRPLRCGSATATPWSTTATSCRCQRSSVSGLTKKHDQLTRGGRG
jgi:hypothetical protein